VTWAVVRFRRRRGRGAIPKISRETPPDVNAHLEKLQRLAAKYSSLKSPPGSRRGSAEMARAIARIVGSTSELFRRLARRGSSDQMAVAQVEYRDQLGKVADVLGEEYYLDIVLHPELWDDPDGRTAAVDAAVDAFIDQIVANIKQVNAAQDLRFQVSLDALARSKRDQSAGFYDTPEERLQP
jgi:hypothetical protein